MRKIYEKLQNNKGLFVFSDPGGAKAVLAIAHKLKQKGEKSIILLSDRKYDFYTDFDLEVLCTTAVEIGKEIKKIKPDYIFTGTSYTSTIEVEALKLAQVIGVKSYSFVDHWTNLSKRFILNEQLYYPDELWLIDSEALRIAKREKVPENIIQISGNPYHEFLQKWNPTISKKKFYDTLRLKLTNESKIILYAPEPLSNIGGIKKFGFDETSVLELLIESLKNSTSSVVLLVKPHPNQKIELLEKVLSKYALKNNKFQLVNYSQTNNLIYHSDLVVGIASNILIEASIMNKNILRFFPKSYSDVLSHLRIGLVVNNAAEMKQVIESRFSK